MEIRVSKHAGFCNGVKRAYDIAQDTLESNEDNKVFSYGELVHNKEVVDSFREKGLRVVNNLDCISDEHNGIIIVRAHGISDQEEQILKDRYEVVDTTCKYVKYIHNKVAEFSKNGYNIIIVGNSLHPEVKGIAGRCFNTAIVINSIDEATNVIDNGKTIVVAQTTIRAEHFFSIVKVLKENLSELEVLNTICGATSKIQEDCKLLAEWAEYMIVIGGKNSSNTTKLKEIAGKYCKNSIHIQTANELPVEEIKRFNRIGITAGASTPDWIIKGVVITMNDLSNNEMMEAIDNSFKRIHRGEVLKGTILYVKEDEISVNIGYKNDGIISRDEISNDSNIDLKEKFKTGDPIDVYVLKLDDGDGIVTLSYKRVMETKGWDDLEVLYNNKEIVKCKVVNPIKGGLSVLIEGVHGFMPASQVSVSYIEDFSVYKGQTLEAKIIDFDKSKRKLVVSRKEIEKSEVAKKVEGLWNSLEVGQSIEGTVERITDFGAFVDIGGVDGLIHISDLSWNRVRKPSDVVSVGDRVLVKVLSINQEKNRISLGLKQTVEEPWSVFIRDAKIGEAVEGVVVSLLDFGAFVKLDYGVDGLLHVSQIANEHVDKPSDVLNIGDRVKVKITEIDNDNRKISLSIKALLESNDKVEEAVEVSEEVVAEETEAHEGCCCCGGEEAAVEEIIEEIVEEAIVEEVVEEIIEEAIVEEIIEEIIEEAVVEEIEAHEGCCCCGEEEAAETEEGSCC